MSTFSPFPFESYPYRLSEDGHVKLQDLREQLFFLRALTLVETEEEESRLLEIRRSLLGDCFERLALQVEGVLVEVRSQDTDFQPR